METIAVRLQGETDWINSIFKVEELNKLIDSSHPLPRISSSLGELLDNNSKDSVADTKREEIEELLSVYVANLNIYQKMLTDEFHTLIITSFRTKGIRVGYTTRVAGANRDHLNNMTVVMVNDPKVPIGNDVGFILVLKFMASNPAYSKDKYHKISQYYKLLQLAKALGSNIDIKRTENPSNN